MIESRSKVRWALGGIAGLVAATIAAWWALDAPRPQGERGPAADAAARRVMAAAGVDGWARTGAVSWRMEGRDYLWDRRRSLARVRAEGEVALVDLTTMRGKAFRGGAEVRGDEGLALVARGYSDWARASFWLYPFASFFDPGARRALVGQDLWVGYDPAPPHNPADYDGPVKWHGDPKGWRQGTPVNAPLRGLTPGDGYLWRLGPQGLPVSWRAWAAILPLGGVQASWEGWQALPTGAQIATRHRGPMGGDLDLEEVRGAERLDELEVGDPFCPLPTARCR